MVKCNYLAPLSYETRNLGLPSFELSKTFLENPDTKTLESNLDEAKQSLNHFFIQVRLPNSKSNLKRVQILERCGFYFVEANLEPQTNLKRNSVLKDFLNDKHKFIPKKYKLEELNVSYLDKNDPEEINYIKEMAENSFSDDRFHVDFNCPEDIANKRFSYWIDDLYIDQNVVFLSLNYLDKPIAFFCHKKQNLILAGFAKKYVNSGLGSFFWLSVLEKIFINGIYQAKTLISVNNTSVLNLYSRIGFSFKNPSVTFHYWKN